MKYTVEEVSQVLRKMTVEVAKEEVVKIREKALKKVQRTARFKGFRLGKAPLSLVESNYGQQIDFDSIEAMLNQFFPQAVEESGISPLSTPKFDFEKLDLDQDFSFSAQFEVKPNFTVDASVYRGLNLKAPDLEVNEEVLADALNRVLDTKATFTDVTEDRLTKAGDSVVVDYQTFDGAESLDPPMTDAHMDLSPGVLLPAIEQALVGKKVGESFDVSVDFDNNARTEHYRGKTVRFAMTVKGIKEKHLPPLTDEVVKQHWPVHDSVESLRNNLRESLVDRYDKQKKETLRQQIIKKIHKLVEFEVPPSLVESEQKRMTRRFLDYMSQDGIGSLPGMTEEILMKEVEEEARFKVKAGLTLASIGEQEKIEVSDDDVEREMIRQAGDRPVQEVKEFVQKNKLMPMIMDTLLEEKILQHIIDNANITKVDPEQLEAELTAEAEAESKLKQENKAQ